MQYRAHGLTIACDRPIAGLVQVPESAHPDIVVHFEAGPPVPAVRSPWFERRYQSGNGPPDLVASRLDAGEWLEFAYADGATFVMNGEASTIMVTAPAALTMDDVTEYLLGPVLGIALRLRGALCLHASAVTIGGRAVAFVGSAGAGKSTMAAAFARGGFPVLADDTIAVTMRQSHWVAAPAFPRLRLWPEAASALNFDAGLAPVAAADEGVRCQLDLWSLDRFAGEAAVMAAIYLIEYDANLPRPRIEPLRAAEALPVLAPHTFANRVLDADRRRQEFHDLADLVTAVPVRRLLRAPNLGELEQALRSVLDDVNV